MKRINEKFFHSWTPESSYVFGFFIADGNLIINKHLNNSYKFCLTQKDPEILHDIKNAMESEHAVSKRVRKDGTTYQYQVSNYEFVKPLLAMGITNDKTYKRIDIPTSLPDSYFGHFLRGMIDGDGSIVFRSIQLSLLENNKLLNPILFRLNRLSLPFPKIYYKKLEVGRTIQVIKIIWYYLEHKLHIRDWLYKDASLFLKRKKINAYTLWNKTRKHDCSSMLNRKFGRLTVLEKLVGNKVLCRCSCGNTHVTLAKNVRRGITKSCGCLSKETARSSMLKLRERM